MKNKLISKIKELTVSLLNFFKKHVLISILIFLIVFLNLVIGIRYLYNDFVYGRFVKVAERYDNYALSAFVPYTDDKEDTFRFFVIPIMRLNSIPIVTYGLEDFKTTENFSIFTYRANGYIEGDIPYYEIYDYFDEKLLFSKVQGIMPYVYNEKEGRLLMEDFLQDENFDPKSIDKHLMFKMMSNDIALVGENLKPVKLDRMMRYIEQIFELDNNNVLIIGCNLSDDEFHPYKYCLRYSNKEKKFYDIDTSEFPDNVSSHNEHRQLVQLKGNKFLLIKKGRKEPEYLSYIGLFELKNNKFVKLDHPIPKNFKSYFFSIDNPLVLDENRVLFVGGWLYGWENSKRCYLYDIKKNKIVRINDFPKKIGNAAHEKIIRTIKTKGGKYYIHHRCIDENKNLKDEFYRFIEG